MKKHLTIHGFNSNAETLTLGVVEAGQVAGGSHQRESELREVVLVLYDECQVSLRRYAFSLQVPAADAEDLVHETFLKLFEHLYTGKDRSNLRGWMFKVLHNLAMTRFKRERWTFSPGEEQWSDLAASISDPSVGPEESLLDKERMTRLHGRMRALSPQQMQCLQLRSEGFRYHEIGDVLGVTVSTVATSLRRAIEKMIEKGQG